MTGTPNGERPNGERPDDALLVQFSDGELDEAESARIGEWVDQDPTLAAKLEALSHLGEAVRGDLELEADGVDARRFHAMWREIDRSLDAVAPRSLWSRLTGWLDGHRGHLMTGVVTAGAVAAIALVVRPPTPAAPQPALARVSSNTIDVQPVALRAPPAIDDLDTPNGDGTVINIEDEDGHTAVIWVTPADTVEGI